MRYTPLTAGEPMRRRYMKRKPAKRIAERVVFRPYLAHVASMSCAGEFGIESPGRGWREHFCMGPVQVAHLGVKPGMKLKCPDNETGALCLGLHIDLDQHCGVFKGWTREERRVWCDAVIARTRAAAPAELAELTT